MPHKQERHFGYIFATVFAIVAFWPLWPPAAPNPWWLGGAGAWVVVALAWPKGLAPLYRRWIAFGHVLGWINSRIILGFIFFLVVTPIGLLLRLFGKDVLRLRTPRSAGYWVRRDQPLDPQSLRNQF